jgi:hypothetical protein
MHAGQGPRARSGTLLTACQKRNPPDRMPEPGCSSCLRQQQSRQSRAVTPSSMVQHAAVDTPSSRAARVSVGRQGVSRVSAGPSAAAGAPPVPVGPGGCFAPSFRCASVRCNRDSILFARR